MAAPFTTTPDDDGASVSFDVAADVSGVTLVLAVRTVVLLLEPAPTPRTELEELDEELRWETRRGEEVTVLAHSARGWGEVGSLRPEDATATGAHAYVLEGLTPGGRYAVWVAPRRGRHAYVEFGADAGTLTVSRSPGGTVSGRVLGVPAGVKTRVIWCSDDLGRSVQGRFGEDGRYEIEGLPAGTWTLVATCDAEEGLLVARGVARTGETLDLRLLAAPGR